MIRPKAPPPFEYFASRRPPQGGSAMAVELGDLRIILEGLAEDLSRRLLDRYAPYSSADEPGMEALSAAPAPFEVPDAEAGVLRVRLGIEEKEYFIEPPPVPEDNPVLIAAEGSRVRYLGYRLAGWFEARGGRGDILLARGNYEPDLRAIENYVRVATAWMAAMRGGALVHAASAVHHGRGYLFFGPSGAGKSTLSAANSRARIVSDDLSLVLPGPVGRLDLIGSPFRGTYTGGPAVVGRFPLVHGFRIVKDTVAAVRSVPRVRAFAELVANLPFLVDSFPSQPALFARFEDVFAPLPLSHLHFRKDDTYWEAIEAAGL